jgi:hypothetical protein
MSTTITRTISVIEKTLLLTTGLLYGIQGLSESLWLSLFMFAYVAVLLYAYVSSYVRHTPTWEQPCNYWFAILLIGYALFRHEMVYAEFFDGLNLLGFITIAFNIFFWAVWYGMKYNDKRKVCRQ